MIIRDAGADLLLIAQADHAAVARRVMAGWMSDGLPSRLTREAVLHATAEHDVGWMEEDEAPSVDPDTGRPYDFISLPAPRRQALWPRAVATLAATSTYTAALVAQHALTIYRRSRHDPAWAAFFAQLEEARDRWFTTDVRPDGSSGGPLDPPVHVRLTFLQDYTALRLGDLLSLTYCNGWTSAVELEGYSVWLEDHDLRVSPDPFEGRSIPIEVTARRIPARRYQSDADLREAIAASRTETLAGLVSGAAPAS
jgi:hypothetical protein